MKQKIGIGEEWKVITTARRDLINAIIKDHDKLKNSYTWKSYGGAAQRRASEFDNIWKFIFKGSLYEIRQYRSNSCKNVYYGLSVFVAGTKKDVRALKQIVGAV